MFIFYLHIRFHNLGLGEFLWFVISILMVIYFIYCISVLFLMQDYFELFMWFTSMYHDCSYGLLLHYFIVPFNFP